MLFRFLTALVAACSLSTSLAASCTNTDSVSSLLSDALSLPKGQPRSIITRSYNAVNRVTDVATYLVKGKAIVWNFYSVGAKSKTSFTAILNQGRLTQSAQTIVFSKDVEKEMTPTWMKRLDAQPISGSDNLRSSVALEVDAQGRLLYTKFLIPSFLQMLRPTDEVEIKCLYGDRRQVVEILTLNSNALTTEFQFESSGVPSMIREKFKDTDTLTTRFSKANARGVTTYMTTNEAGEKVDTGESQVNAAGMVVREVSIRGDMKSETSWIYDQRGNWIERRMLEDGRLKSLMRREISY